MKKLLLLVTVALTGIILSGCAFTPVAPPRGIFFTAQRAPLFPSNQIGHAVGTASAHNVMFLVGWGDCSLATAAYNGGLTSIKNTEYELTNYFIFYQCFTTVAYGEKGNVAPDSARR